MSRPSTAAAASVRSDRKSTRLNSSHTEIYTLSLHDALPILSFAQWRKLDAVIRRMALDLCRNESSQYRRSGLGPLRSEEHTSELQSHRDLHSFPTRRSSDLIFCSVAEVGRRHSPHGARPVSQ